MNRILFFLVIAALFFNACTSSKSLTNCPNFKKTKSFKTVVKSTDKKKKKRIKKQTKETERLAKIKQKSDRKIEKLSKKIRNQLEKKSVIAKLEQLPEHEMKVLHVALSELNITEFENDLKSDVAVGQIQPLNDQFKEDFMFKYPSIVENNNLSNEFITQLKKKTTIEKSNKKLQKYEYRSTNGFAIASLVCGLVGLGILAIVFGAIALSQTNREPERWSGKGMAIAGLVLGILTTSIIFLALLAA